MPPRAPKPGPPSRFQPVSPRAAPYPSPRPSSRHSSPHPSRPSSSAPRFASDRGTPRPGAPGGTRATAPTTSATATEAVYGLQAALAVFVARRDDILQIGYARTVRDVAGDLVRWAQSQRLPCAEMIDGDLARLADSTHHEGLCVLARPRRWTSTQDLLAALARGRGAAVALDRVRNPYNVGAIVRSAAFLGVDAVLLGAPAPHDGLAPMAVRVAEGGSEHVALARTTDLADTLARLRAGGVQVVGADGHAKTSALRFAYRRPAVVVLGHEREGLADRVRAQCDAVVSIPGTGHVDSLNVGVAAAILMAELVRGS